MRSPLLVATRRSLACMRTLPPMACSRMRWGVAIMSPAQRCCLLVHTAKLPSDSDAESNAGVERAKDLTTCARNEHSHCQGTASNLAEGEALQYCSTAGRPAVLNFRDGKVAEFPVDSAPEGKGYGLGRDLRLLAARWRWVLHMDKSSGVASTSPEPSVTMAGTIDLPRAVRRDGYCSPSTAIQFHSR